jgi:hypothetical protein
MPKMRRFLAVVTVAAGATVGGLAAWAAPMGALGTLPQATGDTSGIIRVHDGYWNCWWKYGCKYCQWCYYSNGYQYCGETHKKYCKKKKSYYY